MPIGMLDNAGVAQISKSQCPHFDTSAADFGGFAGRPKPESKEKLRNRAFSSI